MDTQARIPAFKLELSRSEYSSNRDDVGIRLILCDYDERTHDVYGGDSSSPLYGLEIGAYGSHWGDEGRRVYGWHVEYRDCYRVRLEDAECMVKTLKRVARHLDKLDDKYGVAQTLPAYVARVADALGIGLILRDAGKRDVFPTGYRFEGLPVGRGVNYLDRVLTEWVDEGRLPGERAA